MKTCVNGRTVAHQGDGRSNVCATPDVCKTPSPGGPVPVPYVNVARDADLEGGSTTVFIEGHAVALKDSCLATSTGDEPGTAGGGLVSGKTKGKLAWGSASLDVKVEGQGVVRFLDTTRHNGNTYNAAFIQQGGTGWAYGDDPQDAEACPLCQENKATHALLETGDSLALAMRLYAALERVRLEPKLSHLKVLKGRGRNKAGYMIGVLLCKGGGRIYAAMSGLNDDLPGFRKAVELLQQEDSKWTRCGAESPDDATKRDGSGQVDFNQVRNGRGPIPNGTAFFESLHGKVPEFVEDPNSGEIAKRNPPGVCAATKLVQRALAEGHQPFHLTEVWYAPSIAEKVKTVVFRVDSEGGTRRVSSKVESFGDGAVVPSCPTCQVHLTPMLCGSADATCS